MRLGDLKRNTPIFGWTCLACFNGLTGEHAALRMLRSGLPTARTLGKKGWAAEKKPRCGSTSPS